MNGKRILLVLVILTLSIILQIAGAQEVKGAQEQLKTLEKSFDGKIGIYAIDTNNNQIIAYRESTRFPIQSTMKLIGVAALLKKSVNDKNLLQEKIHYTKDDLMFPCPATGKYVTTGMTLEALSEAAMIYSDNPAMNLIIKKLGSPKIVTDFAHSIGNKSFNLEHYEGDLNSNPNDEHDTSTPKDMAFSLQKLTLGNVLPPLQKEKLITWMRNNTISYKRMRFGAPLGWVLQINRVG